MSVSEPTAVAKWWLCRLAGPGTRDTSKNSGEEFGERENTNPSMSCVKLCRAAGAQVTGEE